MSELPDESKGIATDKRAIQAFNSISLSPLSNEESKKLILEYFILEYFHERYNVKLSDSDIEIIIKNTNGIPLSIYWVLSQIETRKLGTESLFKNFQISTAFNFSIISSIHPMPNWKAKHRIC